LMTTQASSRVHLGAHRQQDDNARGAGRGHGAELASSAQGAVRGGSGVLISAHAQPQGQGELLAGDSEQEQLEQALELTRQLAQSARTQKADLPEEPEPPRDLPAIAGLEHIGKVLQASAQTQGQASEGATADAQASSAIRATEGG
ncbi:type VI secretion system Vgr family protein, partial [Comamonas sp. NoAH]